MEEVHGFIVIKPPYLFSVTLFSALAFIFKFASWPKMATAAPAIKSMFQAAEGGRGKSKGARSAESVYFTDFIFLKFYPIRTFSNNNEQSLVTWPHLLTRETGKLVSHQTTLSSPSKFRNV